MRITMLGTGAAFVDPDRAQSGILVTLDNGRNYLFDCGAGITRNMVRANVSPADVSAVFLTHSHHDHICDFPLFVITGWMVNITFVNPLWILAFAFMGAAMMGALGVIAGLWAEKFDQMAAFQNFIIMPMTFLSGVFYSIHSLPPFWQKLSHLNPFFYMIDGFRYGFFGQSDVSPWLSLAVVGTALAAISGLTLHLLRIGYKIRS